MRSVIRTHISERFLNDMHGGLCDCLSKNASYDCPVVGTPTRNTFRNDIHDVRYNYSHKSYDQTSCVNHAQRRACGLDKPRYQTTTLYKDITSPYHRNVQRIQKIEEIILLKP